MDEKPTKKLTPEVFKASLIQFIPGETMPAGKEKGTDASARFTEIKAKLKSTRKSEDSD